MKKKERGKIKNAVLQVLSGRGDRAMTAKQIMSRMGIRHLEEKTIDSVIAELVREGKVRSRGKRRFSLIPPSVRLKGRLQVHPSGYGFVTVEGFDRDVYIPRGKIGNAFHNDLVEIKIEKGKRGHRFSGEVTDVLERGMRRVVGTLRRDKTGLVLKVEDRKFSYSFDVFSQEAKGATAGDIVEGTIEGKSVRRNRRGTRIVRKIGKKPDVESVTLSTIYIHGMEKGFDTKTEREAASFPSQIRKDIKGRVDLTGFPFVTIDGADARDFDDAVCLFWDGNTYRLLVSIADVSEYVAWKGCTDREALRRGTSVYFPDRVIPMLPERLSGDLCSLREKVNRLTVTVDASLNSRGEVAEVRFYPSVIRSRKRFTYDEVQAILDGKKPPRLSREFSDMIFTMSELAGILQKRRVQKGSLDFDLPESKVKISFRGELENIVREERLFSHRIIEEFMLVANVCVAEHLAKKGNQFLYRIHEKPDPLKLKGFFTFAANFDRDFFSFRNLGERFLQRVIDRTRGKPYEKILNMALLRSFKIAKYSPVNSGHFGLGFKEYTHFTSPIRRYPDLMTHRILKLSLGDNSFYDYMDALTEEIDNLGHHLSYRERLSEQAERDVIDKLKALYMVDRVGENFSGVITSVQPFGFFVELDGLFVEGLVHIDDLPDGIYYMDEHGFTLTEKVYGRTYSVGDRASIKVKESDPMKGRVDFLLVEKGK